jgi:hypothetical protein
MSQKWMSVRLKKRSIRWYCVGCLFGMMLLPVMAAGRGLRLTPVLTVGERYDSNIFQLSSDEEDDFITRITTGLRLNYEPREGTLLDFEYLPTFEFFAENTDENDVDHRLSLGIDAPLSRIIQINANNRLVVTQDSNRRVRDIDVDTGTRLTSERIRQQVVINRGDLEAAFRLAPRTIFTALFDSYYEDVEVANEVDELRFEAGGELAYVTNLARQHRVFLRYIAGFFRFSSNGDEDDPGVVNSPDFDVHTVSAGYLHNFNPTLTGTFTLGYSTTVSDDDAIDGNSGVVGGLTLEKTLRTGRARFSYERAFTSGGARGDQAESNRIVLDVAANLSPKVTAGLAGTVVRLKYATSESNDRWFYSVRPRLGYQPLRWWQLTASYIWGLTNFDESERANYTTNNFEFISQFMLRAGWFIDLSYEYRDRRFGAGSIVSEDVGDNEYDRHQVTLSLTYSPTLRF